MTRRLIHAKRTPVMPRVPRKRLPLLSPLILTATFAVSCSAENKPKHKESSPVKVTLPTPQEKPLPKPLPEIKSKKPQISLPKKKSTKSPFFSTYEGVLQVLRINNFERAAEALESRVNRKKQKMKISKERAKEIAGYLLEHLPEMENSRKLLELLPRSTVELIVAVSERDIPKKEAEKIASFLVAFMNHAKMGNMRQFDENHSHVIGRDWHEIDYSGEPMTWQGQKKSWGRHGVINFKTAKSICKYFQHEIELKYHKRIYKPRNRTFPGHLREYCH